jgi:sulfatase maturation enzyme AslB (radical SAM superfamily)
LDFIGRKKIDSLFSTNGVLLGRFADQLATMNRHVFYLLSIDGGEETNDKIRGKGVTGKIIESIDLLREKCLEKGTGLPKIFINYTICEHNKPEDVDEITEIARRLKVYLVNYNFRWFLPREKGEEYNEILEKEFNVKPTNAWFGWVTSDRFEGIDGTLDRVYQKQRIERRTLKPPFSMLIPNFLSLEQAKQYYHNYDELFGITACLMPSYWARVHSTGELIYCPGHPDIIPGNVFERPFAELFLNKVSWQIRRRMETKLFPICNRCCGLYMTYPATRRLQGVSDTMKFYPSPAAKESRFFSRSR